MGQIVARLEGEAVLGALAARVASITIEGDVVHRASTGPARAQFVAGARRSAAIKNLVIDHGIKRMAGKSKRITWKHVLTLARQFAPA